MTTTTTINLSPEELKEMIREGIKDALSEAAEPHKMMRLKEAANYLGIHHQTLYQYVYSGKIKAGRIGTRTLTFKKHDLDNWIKEG